MGTGIAGAFAGLMGDQSCRNIDGNPRVKGAIDTFEQVEVPESGGHGVFNRGTENGEILSTDYQGFKSNTGVFAKASISSISITLSLMPRMLTWLRAMRLGRSGERVAKTPRNGLSGLPRG